MAIKKYTNGSWVPASYRKYGTETDAITTLPATVIGDGTPISSYIIKGNMEQTGTPTPENPITPSGCGERTENLFDDFDIIGKVPSISDGNLINIPDGACTDLIEIPSGLLTLSIYEVMNAYVFLYDANKSYLGYVVLKSVGTKTTQQITNYENAKYARVRTDYYSIYLNKKKIMLNSGSTPLPYEPYGYKLPITLGSTTTNIYLGEVQTTRKIKTLVLTGKESWNTYLTSYYTNVNDYYCMYDVGSHLSVCSHYPIAQKNILPEMHYGLGGLVDGQTNTRWNGNIVFNPSPTISSRTDWQSYLAQQYAAGTPVTIWYVLAEPETGIVNEPLMKIGDYVDSVSGTNLATSGTAQELDINTTLKPSELDLTYHGWHEHQDTKFTT